MSYIWKRLLNSFLESRLLLPVQKTMQNQRWDKKTILKFGNLCTDVGGVLFSIIVARLKIIVAKSFMFIYPRIQEAKYHRIFVPSQMARRYMVHT